MWTGRQNRPQAVPVEAEPTAVLPEQDTAEEAENSDRLAGMGFRQVIAAEYNLNIIFRMKKDEIYKSVF